MTQRCRIHPYENAISFCFSCKAHFCAACLDEGAEHYFCKNAQCQEAKRNETALHAEIRRSIDSGNPKLLVDGKAIGFCDACLKETNGGTIDRDFFNLRSAMLDNARDRCDRCGSVVMDLRKPIPFLSLLWRTVASYRIIKQDDMDPDALYLHRNKFISREMAGPEPEPEPFVDWFEIKLWLETLLVGHQQMLPPDTRDSAADYLEKDEYELAFETLFDYFIRVETVPKAIDRDKALTIAQWLHLDEEPAFDPDFWKKLIALLFDSDANRQ